jgi:hypothetical protein
VSNSLSDYMTLSLCPSGQSIAVQFKDGAGNPANLGSFAPTSDVWTLAITGQPIGGQFALSFNGQTTAPIATPQSDPPAYVLFPITTIVGHVYQAAATWPVVGGGFGTSNMAYEVVDRNHAVLGTPIIVTKNQGVAPSDFADGTHSDSTPVMWDNIGGTWTAGDTLYYVRVSATDATKRWYADGVRIRDTTASTTTFVDDQDAGVIVVFVSGGFNVPNTGQANCYNGTNTQVSASVASPFYAISGGYAALHSALEALSTVGAGNLAVIVLAANVFQITFQGPLADIANGPITCVGSDPAVTLVHTNVGGIFPHYTVNGGSPIQLPEPIANLPQFSRQPMAFWPLRQSAPAFQYGESGGQRFSASGFDVEPSTPSWKGRPATAAGGSGATAQFHFDKLQDDATYRAAITYHAAGGNSTGVTVQVTDSADTVLSSTAVNQAVVPSDFTDQGVGWLNLPAHTITLGDANTAIKVKFIASSSSAGTIVVDGCRLARTSSNVSVVYGPDDVLQFVNPAGYLTLENGTVIPGGTITLANTVGSSLFGTFDDATPTTLKHGLNVEGEGNACPFYSNLARRIAGPMEPLGARFLASNSDGYPTSILGSMGNPTTIQHIPVYIGSNDPGGNGKGLMGPPDGPYVMIWNSANADTEYSLTNDNQTSLTELTAYRNSIRTTDNIRVFSMTANQALQYTPGFYLQLASLAATDGSGHYPTSSDTLRIFPPDPSDNTKPWGIHDSGGGVWVADSPGPPMFHPLQWDHTRGSAASRWMNADQINTITLADFADFGSETALSRVGPDLSGVNTRIVSNIISIVPIGATPAYFATAKNTMVLVTTDVANGTFDNCGDCVINSTAGGGTTLVGNNPGSQVVDFSSIRFYNVHPLSPTQFIGQLRLGFGDHSTFSGSIGAGGTVTVGRGVPMPFSEKIQYCNDSKTLGGGLGWLWENTSLAETDACTTAKADYAAAHLGVGQKVLVEYGNEVWNFGQLPYFTTQHLGYLFRKVADPSLDDDSGLMPDGYIHLLLVKTAIWRARFALAGRSADLQVVLAANAGQPDGDATAVIEQVISQSAPSAPPVDLYATAVYVDNIWPGAPISDLRYPRMTTDQELDHFELMVKNGYAVNLYLAQHRQVLQALGVGAAANLATIPLVNYEAAPQIPNAGSYVNDGYISGQSVMRHPRYHRLNLAILEAEQAAGCVLRMRFFSEGGPNDQPYGNPSPTGQQIMAGWASAYGWGQGAGTGDPAENPDPFDMPNVVSEDLGAELHWASLMAGLSPSSSSPVGPGQSFTRMGSFGGFRYLIRTD